MYENTVAGRVTSSGTRSAPATSGAPGGKVGICNIQAAGPAGSELSERRRRLSVPCVPPPHDPGACSSSGPIIKSSSRASPSSRPRRKMCRSAVALRVEELGRGRPRSRAKSAMRSTSPRTSRGSRTKASSASGFSATWGKAGGATNMPWVGLHFVLHAKWARPGNTTHGVNNTNANIDNYMFWKLHGWIDNVWEKYRRAKGCCRRIRKLKRTIWSRSAARWTPRSRSSGEPGPRGCQGSQCAFAGGVRVVPREGAAHLRERDEPVRRLPRRVWPQRGAVARWPPQLQGDRRRSGQRRRPRWRPFNSSSRRPRPQLALPQGRRQGGSRGLPAVLHGAVHLGVMPPSTGADGQPGAARDLA